MFRNTLRTNGNAITENISKFLKASIRLRKMVLIYGTNTSVKIAFQSGKTDREAFSAHFHIAFAQGPESAKRFVGIGGKHHRRIFITGKETVGNAHCLMRLCRIFNVHAAFRIGNGQNRNIGAVRNIEIEGRMIFQIRFSIFIGLYFQIGNAEGFCHNLLEKDACRKQGSLGFQSSRGFNSLLSFGRNKMQMRTDRFFRKQKGKIQIICFCVCHYKPPE